MIPDSIILDIDGTLWDSTPIVADAYNQAIADIYPDSGLHFTAGQLKQLFGLSLEELAARAFPFLNREERFALLDKCIQLEGVFLRRTEKDLLYPGVADTVRLLSEKYKLFIVSNCQTGYIELFLEKAGLAPYIVDFECNGNNGLSKGANIRLIADSNHLIAPVYVGDIEGDRRACLEAGVLFCHASYGFGTVEQADYVIRRFPDLLTLF